VILGSGWGGYVLARKLDPKKYRAILVSPRSYFVFTPLLNDSAVGTLEFRNVLESVRKRNTPVSFLQGWADDVNFADKTITVEPNVLDQNVGKALVGGGPPDKRIHVPADTFQLGGAAQPGGTGETKVPTFPVSYDKLVIAVGCYSQTFNTPGVRENALFLKDVNDARRIRRRILDLFELARLPFIPDDTKRHLLHFAIVGGGPTGMEFAASLSDLIEQDLAHIFPTELQYVRISLYDVAPKVLPMFDATLADYAVRQYQRRNIEIKTSHQVLSLRKGMPNDAEARDNQDLQAKHRVYTIETAQEGDVGIGMCVWSTGNMANPFVAKTLDSVRRYPTNSASILEGSNVPSPRARQWMVQRDHRTGLILVDDHFRVQLETQTRSSASESTSGNNHDEEAYGESLDRNTAKARATMTDVFAIGDTTIMKTGRLPGTAQVANQQALWLGNALNKSYRGQPSSSDKAFEAAKGFGFRDLGVMTYLGGSRAVLQGGGQEVNKGSGARGLKGWIAYLVWRGAYLTMTLSWRNKFLVPVQWVAVKLFGRDVSRF
jgi:NADH dehydrogenase FAD-containing subunit